jgi:hypothetical protein
MSNIVPHECGRKEDPMTDTQQQGREREGKKAYAPPRLVEYGNIAKLTQNGAGSGNDGGTTANMMMACL